MHETLVDFVEVNVYLMHLNLHYGLKVGDILFSLRFNFAVHNFVRKNIDNQEVLELDYLYQVLRYVEEECKCHRE
jgi:hypothetical protein